MSAGQEIFSFSVVISSSERLLRGFLPSIIYHHNVHIPIFFFLP